MKTIKINVEGCKEVEWKELRNYQLNNLKPQKRDLRKLKQAITEHGFNFPIFVWAEHEYVLDGAGRVWALKEIETKYKIPPIPVVEIYAKDEIEAKKLVLQASSQHGEITPESFEEFTAGLSKADLDLHLVNLEVELDESISNIEQEEGEQSSDFGYPLGIVLTRVDYERWKKKKEELGEKKDTEAFLRLLND